MYNGKKLDLVDNYIYLEVLLNYNGKLLKYKTVLVHHAKRAMFSVILKSCKLYLHISLQLHLFNLKHFVYIKIFRYGYNSFFHWLFV
jgi:hypothetical protein